MGLFERKQEEVFDYSEDTGLDLDKPKVQIIEDEEDTPEQIAYRKRVIKGIITGSVSLLVIGLVVFLVTRPKTEERVLPFDVTNANGYSNTEMVEITDFTITEYVTGSTTQLKGIIITPCNILNKPSPFGNGIKGLSNNDSIDILGSIETEEGFSGWYLVKKDDTEGYLHEEKLQIDVTEDLTAYMSEEEIKMLNKSADELIAEMSSKEDSNVVSDEIADKAQIREMETAIKEATEYQEQIQKELEEQLKQQELGIEIQEVITPPFYNAELGKYFNTEGIECDSEGNVL